MSCHQQKMSLQMLVEKLHVVFAEDKVNVEEVQQTMENYQSNYQDWKKFANFDPHRYTRNLVDTGNGKFNLILLCWGEGQGSGIHDHADSHCWMKVMEGSLAEKLYDWPCENESGDDVICDQNKLSPRQITEFDKNQVTYINDTIGLHRVENNSHTRRAASLHLYSPPFDMCHSFDERTGKKICCKVVFWSKNGVRTPFKPSCSKKDEISTEQN